MDWNEAAKNINGRFVTVGECMMWTGATVHGYGCVSVHNKNYRVHRLVWQLINGVIPSAAHNVDVLHKCGNKLCSNPNHLYIGTARENLNDFYSVQSMPDGRRAFNDSEKLVIMNMIKEKRCSLREISRAVKCDHHKVKRFLTALEKVKKDDV